MTDVPVLSEVPYESYTCMDMLDWFMRQLMHMDGRGIDYLFVIRRFHMSLNDERQYSLAFEN